MKMKNKKMIKKTKLIQNIFDKKMVKKYLETKNCGSKKNINIVVEDFKNLN